MYKKTEATNLENSVKIFKISGSVMNDEDSLKSFCKEFAKIPGQKVLVHGGGKIADSLLEKLKLQSKMVEGRRITDEETLMAVTMVYSGWCNKHITALLQSFGCNAIGLSGCDASVITASKRSPRLLKDGITKVDYGFVGDVKKESVKKEVIKKFLQMGFTPVFCAINHDGKGNLLNTNADTIASSIASALEATLVYCIDKKGVLRDKTDENSVIHVITPSSFKKYYEDGTIYEGMIPKVDNALQALQEGASAVVIRSADGISDDNIGTLIKLE